MKRYIIILAAVAFVSLTSSGADMAADLLKGLEGFQSSSYLCEAGRPTIGYGFTSRELVAKGYITRKEADKELDRTCRAIANKLHKELGAKTILAPHEEAALVSFIFNVGWGNFKSSTMCAMLKKGVRGAAIGAEFHRWVYITKNGRKVESRGLCKRRKKEAQMFLCGG